MVQIYFKIQIHGANLDMFEISNTGRLSLNLKCALTVPDSKCRWKRTVRHPTSIVSKKTQFRNSRRRMWFGYGKFIYEDYTFKYTQVFGHSCLRIKSEWGVDVCMPAHSMRTRALGVLCLHKGCDSGTKVFRVTHVANVIKLTCLETHVA